ncbi:MAG: hypothetical protein ACLQVA_13025 [Candidatus Brocadiia bacterium]
MITQTDLYRRLKLAVDGMPAIDTHVHLDAADPLSPDVLAVVQYHNYFSEVTGAAAELPFDDRMPPRERLRAMAPLLKISNRSAHAWMLRETLRQVYGFDEELTPKNCDRLYDESVARRQRPGRFAEVCRIAGVSGILVHLPPRPVAQCGADDAIFVGLSDLRVPALPDRKALASFEKQSGHAVHGPRDLLEAAVSCCKRSADAGQAGLRVNIPPGCVIRDGTPAERENAFAKAATDKTLSPEETQLLQTLALDAAATGAAASGLAVQIFLATGLVNGVSFPAADPHLLSSLITYLTRYPKVRFEVYTVVESFTQPLGLLAKYRRNCHLGGCWWFCQFPEIMAQTYSLRLDMLPASKWSAFFSDSYVAEWIVGKMALTRKELTKALALKVADGYMTEEDALATAREALFETPSRIYGLPRKQRTLQGH